MARLASPAAATGVANQDIDGEHALEQVGPGEPTARREREFGATVAQGTFEGEDDPPGWIEGESRVGDRGACAITA
jgi:hypothetical protein